MNGRGSPFFKENGNYQASHAINIGFKKLLNLPAPSDPYEAATKDYVDNVNKRPHLIAATASYHSDLIKGDYQFTFGGSSIKSYKKHDVYNGFLMPHNGRIQRFVVEDTSLKIPHDEKDAGTFYDFVFMKQFGFNVPVPLFTLVLIKNNGELVDLGTLNIIFTKVNENIEFDYSFTSNLPDGIEEYKLNVKDVLNIRSEINTIPQVERVLNSF